ncbi:Uma2 family endonuclease [Oculatella sp. FACHB-28]|uniref:Uma2 family endonuclease n=1 Tax=Oculatella sp. FACHB-28 TaxID=2692845 RepID=UPI001F55AA19
MGYIIWEAFENQLEWFQLLDGDYQQLMPDADEIMHSQVFPGLWLAVEALLNNQMERVLEVMQVGLNSPEYSRL